MGARQPPAARVGGDPGRFRTSVLAILALQCVGCCPFTLGGGWRSGVPSRTAWHGQVGIAVPIAKDDRHAVTPLWNWSGAGEPSYEVQEVAVTFDTTPKGLWSWSNPVASCPPDDTTPTLRPATFYLYGWGPSIRYAYEVPGSQRSWSVGVAGHLAGFYIDPASKDTIFGLQLRIVIGTPFDFDGECWGSFDVQISIFFFTRDFSGVCIPL